MKKLLFILALILELTVYGFVYYIGYTRGKRDSDDYKKFVESQFEKVATK